MPYDGGLVSNLIPKVNDNATVDRKFEFISVLRFRKQPLTQNHQYATQLHTLSIFHWDFILHINWEKTSSIVYSAGVSSTLCMSDVVQRRQRNWGSCPQPSPKWVLRLLQNIEKFFRCTLSAYKFSADIIRWFYNNLLNVDFIFSQRTIGYSRVYNIPRKGECCSSVGHLKTKN